MDVEGGWGHRNVGLGAISGPPTFQARERAARPRRFHDCARGAIQWQPRVARCGYGCARVHAHSRFLSPWPPPLPPPGFRKPPRGCSPSAPWAALRSASPAGASPTPARSAACPCDRAAARRARHRERRQEPDREPCRAWASSPRSPCPQRSQRAAGHRTTARHQRSASQEQESTFFRSGFFAKCGKRIGGSPEPFCNTRKAFSEALAAAGGGAKMGVLFCGEARALSSERGKKRRARCARRLTRPRRTGARGWSPC